MFNINFYEILCGGNKTAGYRDQIVSMSVWILGTEYNICDVGLSPAFHKLYIGIIDC